MEGSKNNRIFMALALLLIGLGSTVFWFQGPGADVIAAVDAESDTEVEPERESEGRRASMEPREVDQRPATLIGEVRHKETKAPIEGAVVYLQPALASQPLPVGKKRTPLVGRTDADGAWSLDSVPPGTYAVSASAREHLPSAIPALKVAPAGKNEELVIELAGGGLPLTGKALDYGGGGIEGVVISIARSGGPPGPGLPVATYAAMTDADGNYELWVPNRRLEVSAWHIDYVAERESVDMEGKARTQDFELLPGAVIAGTVLAAETAQPVAGAAVQTRVAKTGSFSFGDSPDVRTDQDGKFVLTQLEAGVHQISATAPELATSAPAEVPVSIGQQVDGVEIMLEKAFDVGGFVVDAADPEQGIAGADVTVFSMMQGGTNSTQAPTEDTGQFVVHGVRPGTYMVIARGEGIYRERGPANATNVTVDDASVDDLIVEVSRGVEVKGVVEPPGPVSLRITEPGPEGGGAGGGAGRGRGFAEDDGTFVVTGVKPGTWKIVATAEDGRAAKLDIEVPDDGLEDVVLELEARARVSGTVTDLKGNPLGDMRVVLPGLDGNSADKRQRARFFGATGASDETRADGSFEVRGLEPGSYELLVVSGREAIELRGASTPGGGLPVVIEGSEEQAGLEIAVDFTRGQIAGLVVDDAGTTLADVWVSPKRIKDDGSRTPPWNAPKPALTDFDGRFVLDGLDEGTYELAAEADDGSLRGTAKNVALGADVTIEVTDPARIEGVVTMDGSPVTNFDLSSGGSVMFGMRRISDPQGRFSIERLDPGTHEVVVSADDGAVKQKVELAVGESKELELELEPWGSIKGRAVYPSGEPADGVSVFATSNGGTKKIDAGLMKAFTGDGYQTDEEGRFEVDGLGAGRVRFRFGKGALGEPVSLGGRSVTLAAGQAKDLGDVEVLDDAEVPEDERGSLGMSVFAGAERPIGLRAADGEISAADEAAEEQASDEDEAVARLFVYVADPGGPAHEAGVKRGDEVVSIDGQPVAQIGATNATVRLSPSRLKKGQTVELRVSSADDDEPRAVSLVTD